MNFPQIEEKILKFWEKEKIFEKSISRRKGKPFFSFYDGPPFATGKPHYGHILATTIKDTVLRYFAMQGYQVPRRVGWDCHGLPVENLIEKELGMKNKREIEKMGIEKFNQACRASVFRCVKDFEQTLKRVGRWADYQDSYATLDNEYIESVWWVLRQLWDQGLVYKDYRVSPYCPRCGTPLSNFEVNQGYKDVKDPSLFAKFKIQSKSYRLEAETYFLAWTTTPWTLPGNVGLAIDSKAKYILVKQGREHYILAKERKEILQGEYSIVKEFSGGELLGVKYAPLFDSLSKQNIRNIENAFQVLPADFVSMEEGTGIVHTAVMYGEDDFRLGKKFNLPSHHTVDESGLFKPEVKEFAGQFVKDADSNIIQNLSGRKLLYKAVEVLHSYPFCWRCDAPLLYYAIESWFVAVTKFKKELVSNNKKIRWVPSHVKEGRFGSWLREARDWNFSRNRFWGAPIPIWQCSECQEYKCIGSQKELDKKPNDLHRPYIDEITFPCKKCHGLMERIPEVFDCWFESGSMPYGQWHYPFEKKSLVEKTFPADFIAEGLDQTRGWFYTLHVLSSALTLKNIGLGKEKPAFKNVIVNGLILDAQGRKLSKRLKNYPEPKEVFDNFGADSLRYFLLSSTPIGEDYRFSLDRVREIWAKVISTLAHSYLFFETYKSGKFNLNAKFKPSFLLDKWIVSKLNNLNYQVVQYMNAYQLTKASRLFGDFIDEFSNWYIRRSRSRFQKPQSKKDLENALQILSLVLLTLSRLAAPFIPFLSEEIYQKIKQGQKSKHLDLKQSVHLEDWPKVNKRLIDNKLEEKMVKVRELVAQALAQRGKAQIKVRQPLTKLRITDHQLNGESALLELIKDEVNVREISFGKTLKLDTKITPKLREEGIIREIVHALQTMRKTANLKPKDTIIIHYSALPPLSKILEKNKKIILKETFSSNIYFDQEAKTEMEIARELYIDKMKLWIGIKKR